MGSPEDRQKHSRRLKRKKKEASKRLEGLKPGRVRSVIAKELVVNKKYQQQVIRDRRGREVVSFHDLVEAINDE